MRGRVGSLLEVGTGFHPELTGRENVYLSGAILGMGKSEINRKFDEIGNGVRWSRAVHRHSVKAFQYWHADAACFLQLLHISNPEILLVDEVLAVGDIEFQKKCLGKMQDVSKSGRTIVFVSHQMNQIRRLCERVLWVDGGKLRLDGLVSSAVSAYEESTFTVRNTVSNSQGARFLSWEVIEPKGENPYTAATGNGGSGLESGA